MKPGLAPYPGQSRYEGSQPACLPHEYVRNGTAKLLTLFEPASGQLRVRGVPSITNAMLHPWIKGLLGTILDTLRAGWSGCLTALRPWPLNGSNLAT